MAQVKFNENGDIISAQTGEVLGNVHQGQVDITSNNAQTKSLQQLGVALPQPPEEEDEEQDNNSSDKTTVVQDKVIPNVPEQPKKEEIKKDNGPSSFKKQKSKYEVSSDSYFVIRFGLYQNLQDGRFIPIKLQSVDEFNNAQRHWVKFRMWNYREELKWKQECTEYHTASRSQVINVDRLNEKKIRNLMLDWSFGEYDDKLKLLHCDGVLSDESYNLFYNMYPSIANSIVDLMNLVLESNQ